MKVSPAFSKAAESRGRASGRAPQSAEPPCALISAGGGPRGNPRRGFPLLFFRLVRVRRYVGWGGVGLSCLSTPFLLSCQKKRCRAAKEKRFFYLGGSTIRVSATSRWTGRFSADFCRGLVLVGGLYGCADTLGGGRCPSLPFDPISLVLAQRNGVEPPKKSAFFTSVAPPFA